MITFAVFLIGFTAMASQIVFMRELLVVFSGNELSIGFVLASWLLGGGIGSLILGRFTDRIRSRASWCASAQLILVVILPLGVVLIRLARHIIGLAPGQLMPPAAMAAVSLGVLVPPCAILGLLFSLACRLYAPTGASGPARIGGVYIREAVGSLVGGLVVTCLFFRHVDALTVMGIVCTLNALSAFLLQERVARGERARRILRPLAAGSLLLCVLLSAAGAWVGGGILLERSSWPGYDLLADRSSVYGKVAVVRRAGQISFFDNGLHLYTVPDPMHAEESVHYALLEHPDPRSVLLIGGGVGGLIEETLRHPVRRLDYVELDPLIVEMARAYLPPELSLPLDDPRVRIVPGDGRLYVKRTPRRYDCVIVNIGDPFTAQINRYYTLRFFREVRRVLRPGGILSFSLTGSESYVHTELRRYLASIHATLRTVYDTVLLIPGERIFFIATDALGARAITRDPALFERRSRERGLRSRYVRDYYLFAKLSPEKIDVTQDAVAPRGDVRLNLDFWPVSYYYATVFWASLFRDHTLAGILSKVGEGVLWQMIAALYGVLILLAVLCRLRPERGARAAAGLAVVAAGFTGMSLQVMTLLAFQIVYGYLFYKMGVLLTAYMVGLACGAWMMVRALPSLRMERRLFLGFVLCLACYAALLPPVFSGLNNAAGTMTRWIGANVVFVALPALAGALGGAFFPLAGRLLLRDAPGTGSVGGMVYGLDLAGASVGALVTGSVLIPVVGFAQSCLIVSCLNAIVALILVMCRYASQ